VGRSEPSVALLGAADTLSGEALLCMLATSPYRVLGAFPSVEGLERRLAEERGVLDVAMVSADADGDATMVAALRQALPETKLLLLCDGLTRAVIRCASLHSAEGVALTSETPAEVLDSLRNVIEGRSVMPAGWHAAVEGDGRLSERERQVLELVCEGLSNRDIADSLVVSPNTVKFHLRSIYAKLGVQNRVQAARAARAG
jgi:DNA-binding NarL/FixJ family response regulator